MANLPKAFYDKLNTKPPFFCSPRFYPGYYPGFYPRFYPGFYPGFIPHAIRKCYASIQGQVVPPFELMVISPLYQVKLLLFHHFQGLL